MPNAELLSRAALRLSRWERINCLIAATSLAFSLSSESHRVFAQTASLVNPAAALQQAEELPQPLPRAEVGLALPDFEEMALGGNPAIVRAAALVSAARGNWVQVGLKPNPTIGYEGQQLGSGGLAEQHGVGFGQEIVTGHKLRLNRAVARGDIEVAEQELAAIHLSVLTDVRKTFYQVVIAQQQITVADELILVSQKGAEAAKALLDAQQVGRADVLQASLERDQAELMKETASRRVAAAWRELSAVIGQPNFPLQPVVGDAAADPCDFGYDETLARLLSESPEMAMVVAQLERSRAALARARAQTAPNVSFQGLVNWQDNGIGGKADGTVGISVPLPLFDRNQGGIARADREVVAAQQAIAQKELDLQQRLAPVFERFENARARVLKYRSSILPTAQEALGLTRQMYEVGQTDYTGLLTAQRTFGYANRDYLDSVLQLRLAEAELNGLLLSGSLQSDAGR